MSVEKRPCGKLVTVVNNVTNPEKLLSDLQSMLGAGGSVKGNAIEVQGEHTDRVTKYLMAHKSQLVKVANCKEPKPSVKPGESSSSSKDIIQEPPKDEQRRESGKPRWSATKVATVQAAKERNARTALGAPPGWDDDPRRCPFNWIYCSGICTTQTMEEFARRKQQVQVLVHRKFDACVLFPLSGRLEISSVSFRLDEASISFAIPHSTGSSGVAGVVGGGCGAARGCAAPRCAARKGAPSPSQNGVRTHELRLRAQLVFTGRVLTARRTRAACPAASRARDADTE